MAQVIWTTWATLEIELIADYLTQYSQGYARNTVSKIYRRAGQLNSFPLMGRVIPEIDVEHHRELIEGRYRVMYELLDADIILIQRVIHQSQDFMP